MEKLKTGILYLCYCPDWCETQYQIAKWNGKEFYYEGQPNDEFDSHVHSYYPLEENKNDMYRYIRE